MASRYSARAMKLRTLQQAIQHYTDEQVCIDEVAAARWPDGVKCPACDTDKPYYLKTQKRWKCRECRRQFSVKLGTIFEDSPIPLTKWMLAMWMLANCKNGVSSYEVSRAIGVTQKSAWFMLHRIRFALHTDGGPKASGEVECDETFVGGKQEFMHRSRKVKLQAIRALVPNRDASGHVGKTAVMGILERDTRQIRARVLPNVRRETIQAEVFKHVEYGSSVYTDEGGGYRYLPIDKFVHGVVNHEKEYVNGRVHTNGLENFWALLKRGIKGTYVAVEPFHLDRYVDEQVFRFNTRKDASGKKLNDGERFQLALSQVAGKRLTFAEVTGKVGETAF